MDKVLVVKAIEPNYNTLSGGPQFVIGGGRSRDGPVGRTLRERAGGAVGGLVGVLGALAGRHRSLGGLAQSMVSGGAQGKALGSALGRKLVGRAGQRRADIREGRRQQRAQSDAELAEDVRSRGQGMLSSFNPAAKFRRINQEVRDREDRLLDRTNMAHRSMGEAQRQAGDYVAGRVAVARNQAEREAQAEQRARAARRGTEFGEQDIEDAEMMRNMREFAQAAYGTTREDFNERMNAAFQANRRQGGGGVRVDPSPPSQVLVRDASGMPVGDAQQMAGQALQLPAPAGGAGAEINDIERAGNQEAIKEGTDHTGNYGGRLALPAPQEGEEEEEENEMGTVGVVDSMRPTTLEQIQRQRQQEAQGGN